MSTRPFALIEREQEELEKQAEALRAHHQHLREELAKQMDGLRARQQDLEAEARKTNEWQRRDTMHRLELPPLVEAALAGASLEVLHALREWVKQQRRKGPEWEGSTCDVAM
jgi:predicted  nucleic acid-binding Zn-ribbon protein